MLNLHLNLFTMNEKLSKLYQEVILRHNEVPFQYEKRTEFDYVLEAYNPICGDQFKLYLKLEDNRIQSAYFHGYGCAISKAATSVLIQKIQGRSLDEIQMLCTEYDKYVKEDTGEPTLPLDEELEAFAAARSFPGRLQCATLSWDEMQKFLKLKM